MISFLNRDYCVGKYDSQKNNQKGEEGGKEIGEKEMCILFSYDEITVFTA